MTQIRRIIHAMSVMALVSILVWGISGTFAADTASETATAPVDTASPPVAEPPASAGQAQAIDELLEPGQFISGYSCSPSRACEYRACLVGPSGQYWFRADYLLWWTQGARVCPLITTSDTNDQGVIGQPSTQVLFGDERVNGESRSSYRLRFGWWFHCGRTAGIEFDYFNLGEQGTDFSYSSNEAGQPLYARPFYDVNPAIMSQNAELISDPTWLRGSANGRIDEYFQSAGVNLRLNLRCNDPCCSCCGEDCCEESCDTGCCGDDCCDSCGSVCSRASLYREKFVSLFDRVKMSCHRIDFIAGYRHYQLSDSFRIHESLEAFENHEYITAGSTFDIVDEFRSRNDFHGGELGLVAQFYHNRWSLELLAKMAIGNNHRNVTIGGQSVFQAYGDDPVTYDEGILALNSNIGRYSSDQFVVIPQFGAEIGYQVNCHLRAYVGYNLILWNDVVRASQQIDYTLNSSYFPPADDPSGDARPTFSWDDSDFWAQGMNFGLEYRF